MELSIGSLRSVLVDQRAGTGYGYRYKISITFANSRFVDIEDGQGGNPVSLPFSGTLVIETDSNTVSEEDIRNLFNLDDQYTLTVVRVV